MIGIFLDFSSLELFYCDLSSYYYFSEIRKLLAGIRYSYEEV